MIDRGVAISRLEYNSESGILTWKEMQESSFSSHRGYAIHLKRFAGKRAGSYSRMSKGYWCRRVRVNGHLILEHRLIWLMMTGRMPSAIDHINHDATDNRWENLREVGQSANARNASKRKDNTSGYSGVTWNKDCMKWQAQVGVVRNKVRRNYNLGLYHDKMDAVKAVLLFRQKNGFHENHGQ